jgi:D-sorbitol dehydrogenase (acceptor)
VALITGGGQGIGREIALRYADEGAACALADLKSDQVKQVADQIRTRGGRAIAIAADVTKTADVERMIGETVAAFGALDILVNNAGIIEIQPFFDVTPESWDRVMAVNARAVFFVMQAAARRMVAQGKGGRIINMASEASRRGGTAVQYCASKAAVMSLTRSGALSLIKHGINVNAIAPGVIDTAMWDDIDRQFTAHGIMPAGEVKRQGHATTPFGRAGTPADLVGAAVFLASADSTYIIGHTLDVNGGRIMS